MNLCKISPSTLYIIPTPIGNLLDITFRAVYILKNVDIIAAEDTRKIKMLFNNFSIEKKCIFSLHRYNEYRQTNLLIRNLEHGKTVALISDSGTPVINDPGQYLVKCCREIGIRVVPLPGACAAIVALSASGFPSSRFCYEGFLPTSRISRLNILKVLKRETRTMIFYESTHRLLESLEDMIVAFGSSRYAVLARELTKPWESIHSEIIEKLFQLTREGKICCKGEIVIVVEGFHKQNNQLSEESLTMLHLLLKDLPLKKAISIVSKIYGIQKRLFYQYIVNNQ